MTFFAAPPPEPPDERTTRLLRALVAPPADAAYWESLEQRILARLREDREGPWWAVLEQWARPALIAASIAVVAATLALAHARDREAQLAYETVLAAPTALQIQTAIRPGGISDREATLRYLISP